MTLSPESFLPSSPESGELDVREILMNEAIAARDYLNTVGSWLVRESIEDGHPERDVTLHPDYVDAQQKLQEARDALDKFAHRVE